MREERVHTVVIGGGQAGLSVGYQLTQRGIDCVILDAGRRVGEAWRNRWDSLRLFTPARYSGLAGLPFPAPARSFPTKDQMADYLEAYARRFRLPVRLGVRVEALSRRGRRFFVAAGERCFEADNVVVAMATYQQPVVPAFARELRPDIVQIHSKDYRNPSQLKPGGVLLVGAGNSGADIAMEVVRHHLTWLSGRDTGHIPFRVDSLLARLVIPVLFRIVFHRVLTVRTPIGRTVRPRHLSGGKALIRVKPVDLARAGVARVPRTAGVREGNPLLEDGRVLDVANVIWCTGFESGFSWIRLPVLGPREPMHDGGVVASEPGLFFVGLEFLYSASSSMIHGLERDAARIAAAIAARGRREAHHPAAAVAA